jgi:hypothetical protein
MAAFREKIQREEQMITTRSFVWLGALLAAGLAIFGVQIGRAVQKGREFDRYFTVRGLSEREVKATLAIWPVRFETHADDLPKLKQAMERDRAIVQAFFRAHEIADDEVSLGLPGITDRAEDHANPMNDELRRYKAVVTLVVRSTKVDVVKRAIQDVAQLLDRGVRLSHHEYHGDRTQFLFEGVNALKPSMIEEATANARAAAAKFAQDSKARVGAIRRATQGVLEIDDRDVASPEQKIVRVVTTVEFFIE